MNHSKLLLIIAVLIIFIFSGCTKDASGTDETIQGGVSQIESNGQGPKDQPNSENNNSQDALSVNGIIKSISDKEITVAVNPMAMPDSDGNNSGGPGKPDGDQSNPPDGNNPPGDSKGKMGDAPSPEGDTPQSGNDVTTVVPDQKPEQDTPDVSAWDEATYKIDSQTVIVKMEGGKDGTETEIDISELSEGASIMISLRSSDLSTIDKIVLMNNQVSE